MSKLKLTQAEIDKIVVVDYVRTIEGTVKGSQVGNIGANIYYDEIKN